MRLRTRSKEDPTIDLASLIDVVFILLLFFMVSATFERQAILKVDLPEASEVQTLPDKPKRLELVIDADGRMFINDRLLTDSGRETLRAALTETAGDDRRMPLVLRADRATPHHYVVTAMDVAAQMGFRNLSIATDRSGGKER